MLREYTRGYSRVQARGKSSIRVTDHHADREMYKNKDTVQRKEDNDRRKR